MTNVAEVVLFYSKYSKECGPCVQYIMQNKLPVTLIPLDDKESRNRVLNGSIMQIKNVPSMVVSYVSGDVQLYIGGQKIIAWFSAMTRPPNANGNSRIPNPDGNTHIENPIDQYNSNTSSQKKRKTKKKKSVKHIKPQSDPSGHTELIFGDESDVPSNNVHNNTHLPSHLTSKLSTTSAKPSPNEGIMAMAKQMAAERDRQLNVNNNDGS
jgi:hypothetical protein